LLELIIRLDKQCTEQSVTEEESEEESQRRRYPNYYKHKDAGSIFRVQRQDGTSRDVTPEDEEDWDEQYKKYFPGETTPNDKGQWFHGDNPLVQAPGKQGVAEGLKQTLRKVSSWICQA